MAKPNSELGELAAIENVVAQITPINANVVSLFLPVSLHLSPLALQDH